MSPLEKGADYIQIGLGLQNLENLAADQQYNYRSPDYNPQKKKYDSSKIEAGYKDQYSNDEYERKSDEREKEDGIDDGKYIPEKGGHGLLVVIILFLLLGTAALITWCLRNKENTPQFRSNMHASSEVSDKALKSSI